MIFRRKKSAAAQGGKQPVMRGRDSIEDSGNPLARRFHPEDEPDTIDLQQPAGFNEEPETAGAEEEPAAPGTLSVITVALETGKFYVQPGPGDNPVLLAGEPVRAPTELRRGDRVVVGDVELQILPSGSS
jgi:hypothetical protein